MIRKEKREGGQSSVGKKGNFGRKFPYLAQDTPADDRWWPCLIPETWKESAGMRNNDDPGLPSLNHPVRVQFEEDDLSSFRVVKSPDDLAFNLPISNDRMVPGKNCVIIQIHFFPHLSLSPSLSLHSPTFSLYPPSLFHSFIKGTRVAAVWMAEEDEVYYQGVIEHVNLLSKQPAFVHFDDGQERWCSQGEVRYISQNAAFWKAEEEAEGVEEEMEFWEDGSELPEEERERRGEKKKGKKKERGSGVKLKEKEVRLKLKVKDREEGEEKGNKEKRLTESG